MQAFRQSGGRLFRIALIFTIFCMVVVAVQATFIKMAMKGVAPDRKIGPNRRLYVMSCTISFTAIFVLWVVVAENVFPYVKSHTSSS